MWSARVATILFLTVMPLYSASANEVRVIEPRGFGYFVGDTLSRRVEIDVAPGELLDAASLPQRGPVNYWLELRSATSTHDRGKIFIDIGYQSFFVPIDPKQVKIPETKVRIKRGEQSRDVVIPAFSLVMSPIREIFPERSEIAVQTFLRADAVPQLIPTGRLRTWVVASALSTLLAVTLLARHRAWWPFSRRADRPFSRAARAISRAGQAAQTSAGYRESMMTLHRAFDATNGGAVLADDIGEFLKRHAVHAESREQIKLFFEASRLSFFGGDSDAARMRAAPDMLQALATTLARQERAAR